MDEHPKTDGTKTPEAPGAPDQPGASSPPPASATPPAPTIPTAPATRPLRRRLAGRTAFEAMASKGRSGEYRERRRGWIREHSSDDGFLIFLAVVVVIGVLGLIGYKLIVEFHGAPPPEPVPLIEVFSSPHASESPPGTVTVTYDFALRSDSADLRESCPQMDDWQVPGGVISPTKGDGGADMGGVLVSGRYSRYIPYFTPGDLSVECDAALLYGSEIALQLGSIEENRLDDSYRFEIYGSREPGGPASAVIVEYRAGQDVRRGDIAQLPEVRAQRVPPIFHRIKLERVGEELRGSFDGKVVCRLQAAKMLPGAVMLLGPNSQTAFDNVTIVGRPHPEFVKPRAALRRLFHAPAAAPADGTGARPDEGKPSAPKPAEAKPTGPKSAEDSSLEAKP